MNLSEKKTKCFGGNQEDQKVSFVTDGFNVACCSIWKLNWLDTETEKVRKKQKAILEKKLIIPSYQNHDAPTPLSEPTPGLW